jgi:cell division protein FtsL
MNLRVSSALSSLPALRASLRRQLRLSPLEATFLGVAILFCSMVSLFYVLKVRPLSEQVTTLEAQIREQATRLDRRQTEEKRQQDQLTNAEAILDSLRRFEANLKPDQRGMTQIINEIDQLGRTHRILVGDASYRLDDATPLTDAEGNPLSTQQGAVERKWNIYPRMGIETTVVGDYPNLRRFLAQLEKSQQFVIIQALAFQGEADRVRRAAGNPNALTRLEMGSPESIPVSLKIDLETYFQRPVRMVGQVPEPFTTAPPPVANGRTGS